MRSNFQVLAIEYPSPTNSIIEAINACELFCCTAANMPKKATMKVNRNKSIGSKMLKTVNGKLGSAKYEMNCGMCMHLYIDT